MKNEYTKKPIDPKIAPVKPAVPTADNEKIVSFDPESDEGKKVE